MSKGEGKNQGEGNKEADRKFREAEDKARARSKGEDPTVKNQSGGSASGRSGKGTSKR
jgi:hypothetical protein